MFEEIRDKGGKLLFMWDADSNAVEIVIKGEKRTVFLNIQYGTYRVISPYGRSPPLKATGTDKPFL